MKGKFPDVTPKFPLRPCIRQNSWPTEREHLSSTADVTFVHGVARSTRRFAEITLQIQEMVLEAKSCILTSELETSSNKAKGHW